MEKKPFFKFNAVGVREEALDVVEFIGELKELFEKHKIKTIRGGVIGLNEYGEFGVIRCDIDLLEK